MLLTASAPSVAPPPKASFAPDPRNESDETPDDELDALLAEIQTQSTAAFESLYMMTSSRLFAVVSNVKSDRAEAEAVLQEVFVNIWHECSHFDVDRDDASEWLIALARRTALNSARHRRQKDSEARREDRFAPRGSELPEPLNIVVRAQLPDAPNLALTTLSAEQRAGLTLAFYDCLSPDEIARRLAGHSVARESVRRAAHAARRPRGD